MLLESSFEDRDIKFLLKIHFYINNIQLHESLKLIPPFQSQSLNRGTKNNRETGTGLQHQAPYNVNPKGTKCLPAVRSYKPIHLSKQNLPETINCVKKIKN
ncbi:hypothetical protein Dimus_035607 [Dionaea muscipula]